MAKRTRDSVTMLVIQALSVRDTVRDVAGPTVWTEVGRVGRVGRVAVRVLSRRVVFGLDLGLGRIPGPGRVFERCRVPGRK